MSLQGRSLDSTPVTIIDFETTGLSPKIGSRVVEVAAVRVEPGADPELVIDTLIDPEGPVYASEIHGIEDEDVVGAPRFCDIGGDLAYTLRDGPFAAFNAAFDAAFLEHEYSRYVDGRRHCDPPYICLMYMRPLLGLGPRSSLEVATSSVGLGAPSHRAADDALAAAHLWVIYRNAAVAAGLRTFDELRAAGKYKFLSSFSNKLFGEPLDAYGRRPCTIAAKPRWSEVSFVAPDSLPALVAAPAQPKAKTPAISTRRRQYWRALQEALTDGVVTGVELREIAALKDRLKMDAEDVQAVHARVAAERLTLFAEDHRVDRREAAQLKDLFWVLRDLGWAPGDAVS